MEQNSTLYEHQFGFRKNHSTVQAVIKVLDNIYEHCDSHEITAGICVDLQKTFDTVNNTILLKNLNILWSKRHGVTMV